MKAQLLVLHREERYPGEYAPEIVSVVDEITLDDNPEWWSDEIASQKEIQGDDVSAWAVIEIDLDRQQVMQALHPDNKVDVVGQKKVDDL